MLEGLSVQDHYEACIEMWNYIAENNLKYKPPTNLFIKDKNLYAHSQCFACELYNYDGVEEFEYCVGCPFTMSKLSRHKYFFNYAPCESNGPYRKWQETRKRTHAVAIAQLFIDNFPSEDEECQN